MICHSTQFINISSINDLNHYIFIVQIMFFLLSNSETILLFWRSYGNKVQWCTSIYISRCKPWYKIVSGFVIQLLLGIPIPLKSDFCQWSAKRHSIFMMNIVTISTVIYLLEDSIAASFDFVFNGRFPSLTSGQVLCSYINLLQLLYALWHTRF